MGRVVPHSAKQGTREDSMEHSRGSGRVLEEVSNGGDLLVRVCILQAEGPACVGGLEGQLTLPGHSGCAAHRSLLDNVSGRLFAHTDGLVQGKGGQV